MNSKLENFLKKIMSFDIYIKFKRFVRHFKLKLNPSLKWSYRKEYINDTKKSNDEKYFVIRRSLYLFGLMGAWRGYLVSIPWIEQHGYKPAMYFGKASDIESANYCKNIWDIFFDLNADIRILNKSNETVFGELDKGYFCENNWTPLKDDEYYKKDISYVECSEEGRKYYSFLNGLFLKYAPIRKELIEDFDIVKANILNTGKSMAVVFREQFTKEFQSAYVSDEEWKRKLEYHPIGMNVEDQINLVSEKALLWGVDYIFVATEYKETLEKCKEKFGDRIVCIDRERNSYNYTKEYAYRCFNNLNTDDNEKDEIERYKDYLCELYISAKCDYFIGPHCSGTLASLIINGGEYNDYIIISNSNESAQ